MFSANSEHDITQATKRAIASRLQSQKHLSIACCLLAFTAAQAQSNVPSLLPRDSRIQAVPVHQIVLDISVHDQNGSSVQGLNIEDFRIRDEDQPPKDLRLISEAELPSAIVFVLDALNGSNEEVSRCRDAVDHYLRRGTSELSSPVSIVLLDGFARRPKQSKQNSAVITVLGSHTGSIRVIAPSKNGLELAQTLQKQQLYHSFEQDAQGAEGKTDRTAFSLEALQAISDVESKTPGHKIVIWLGPAPATMSVDSGGDKERIENYEAYLTTGLRNARVTLYQLDPSALGTGFQWSGAGDVYSQMREMKAHEESVRTGSTSNPQMDVVAGPGGRPLHRTLSIPSLAQRSGGMVLGADRRMEALVDRCLLDANTFYTFSFVPAPSSSRLQIRRISATVLKSGLAARGPTDYYVR